MSEWRYFAAALCLFFAIQIIGELVEDDPGFWLGIFLYRTPALGLLFIALGIVVQGVRRGA